jgi:hypothetical protein
VPVEAFLRHSMLRDSWHGIFLRGVAASGMHAGILSFEAAGKKFYMALNRLFKQRA